MKTTLKFLAYGMMVFALVATSCSKDSVEGPLGPVGPKGEQGIQGSEGPQGEAGQDGEALGVPGPKGDAGATGTQGPAGLKGDAGATGAQGPAGANGQNGSSGARVVNFSPITFPESTYYKANLAIASNEVVFGYIQNIDNGTWNAIPTANFVGHHYGTYSITTSYNATSFTFRQYDLNGNIVSISPDATAFDISALKLVIIKVGAAGSSGKGNRTDAVLARLANANVEVSDYAAVTRYFGVEY